MKNRSPWPLLFMLAVLASPSFPAHAADDEDEMGFDIEEMSPQERARRDQLLRELTLPRSWIELGSYYVSDDSYKFGDYSGFDEQGFKVLGNFDLRRRAPWDGDETWYLRLRGYNLGLDSRSLHGEYGQQGRFDVWGDYSQIRKFYTDDMWTPFSGVGSSRLTLPPSWVGSDSTAGFATLDRSLQGRKIDKTRRRFGGGASFQLPWNLEFEADYKREDRDGRKITSAIIGSNGGNPRSSIVPEPIDYTTQEVNAKLRFNGERSQFQLGYYYSRFDDAKESLTWQNPFQLGSWDASASYPFGYGSKSTPPDNDFHQVLASGGTSLDWWDTRVTGDVAFGWMRQSEPFLPYTVNPTLDASITREVPRGSLNGRIDTTAANFRIDSRPLPKLRLNGRFRYDDRDNQTPRDVYIYIPGDAQGQGMISGSTARINRPYSYKLMEYGGEAAYEIFRRTEASVHYRHQQIERTYSEVAETDEDIYSARLSSAPFSWVNLRVEGELSNRVASQYHGNLPFLKGATTEHLDTLPPDERFENNPLLRKFYFEDRNRSRIQASLMLLPAEWLNFRFAFDRVNDDYNHAEIGLVYAKMSTYTLDVTLIPCEHFTTNVFFTHEQFRTRQEGHSFSGNAVEANLADLTRRWTAFDRDDVDTIGWGFDLNVLDGRLTFEGDAIYSRSEGDITVDTRTPLMPVVLPPGSRTMFPTIKYDLLGFTIAGRYRIDEHLSVRLGYSFERLNADDWSVDDIFPSSLPRVLTTGGTTPDYLNHVVALSIQYEFR